MGASPSTHDRADFRHLVDERNMSNEVPVTDTRKTLEKKLEAKRQDIEKYRRYINRQKDESVGTLSSQMSKNKTKLEACWKIQVIERSKLSNEIERLRERIVELKLLEDQEREVENIAEQLKDYTPIEVFGSYPEELNSKVADEYRGKFKTWSNLLTSTVPKLNIIMIGETGAGKSSFLNTFATALCGLNERKDIYRTSPGQGREKSATQEIRYDDLIIGNNGTPLPCRFYDIPGLDQAKTIEKGHLLKIINGEFKIDCQQDEHSDEDFMRINPTLADKIHCILYVIKATSSLSPEQTPSLKLMKEIKDINNSDDGVRQFVVVTAIDEIGVPNKDMKNAYRYRIVQKICKKVSVAFDVDLLHVLPVSNYFEEVRPNNEKNAMSLFNLWRVFNSGKEYIERNLNRKGKYDGFRRLLLRRE